MGSETASLPSTQDNSSLYNNVTTIPIHSSDTPRDWGVSLETSSKGYDTVYLSDDHSLELIPEFIAANYIDYVYVPVCAGLGIVGNCLAFCVLIHALRQRGATTYVYMAALCFTDTLVQVVNILFLVRKFPGHETLHAGTCGLAFFLLYFSIHYSVALMVTMTVERYLAITFPLKAARWFSLHKAKVVVSVQALLVLGLDVQHFIIRGMEYSEAQHTWFCVPLGEANTFYLYKVWPWMDAVIYCYAPLSCLVVFNVLILKQIHASRSFQSRTASGIVTSSTEGLEKTSRASKMSDREGQVTRMLLLVTTTFLVLVSPMAVIIVVERYFWIPQTPLHKAQYHLVRTIFNNLDYTNHALNFILYFFSGRRFRNELRQTFSCLCPGNGSGQGAGASVISNARQGNGSSSISRESSVCKNQFSHL